MTEAYVICMLIAMVSSSFMTTCIEGHNKYRREEAVKYNVANLNELVESSFVNIELQC